MEEPGILIGLFSQMQFSNELLFCINIFTGYQ